MNVQARVLRVFADEKGSFGNPVGIIVDEGQGLSTDVRQQVAIALGYSESIFINDVQARSISIFTPQNEIAFAGHAAVGAAWLLRGLIGGTVDTLHGRDGRIETWTTDDVTWVRSELRTTPPWWHERLESAEAIESLHGPQDVSQEHTQLWAWTDKSAGQLRARTFAAAWGIPEDEANGSGCMRLAAALGLSLRIVHGKGSVIYAKPGKPGWADVGGRVVEDPGRIVEQD